MASLLPKLPGVAFITGAGGTGIGAATARAFVHSGCHRVAITDVDKDTLWQTRSDLLKINPEVQIISSHGDVSDEAFVNEFASDISKRFTRLDYAVNCAGILGKAQRSTDVDSATFDKIMRVNLRGSWLTSRAALRLMLQQKPLPEHPEQTGSVVNVASQLGIVARPEAAAYCASKSAIINMTRSDAIDYSKDGIRINAVCPGLVASPMTTGSADVEDRLRSAINIAPMKRMGRPEEVANAVTFLCSSQASFIQGHALVVDGGYTIN